MELQQVTRYTGKKFYNSNTGLDELEIETVLQFRESTDDDWADVPTIDQTVRQR